jgi:hypothetical protein
VLNLPDGAVNRRLRCPKCETRFYSGDEDSTPPKSAPAVDSAGFTSDSMRTSRHSEPDLPVVSGTFRDTFDLPLLDDSGPPAKGPRPAASPVASLFDDIPQPRKLSRAEARLKPRRCPTCGSLVLAGMSLCERCGLDLDTGVRHTVEVVDDDECAAAAAAAAPTLPASILLIGVTALAVSAVLMGLSLIVVDQPVGKASFGLVCAYGIFASIQFLRARSYKLLLIAMMLGAAVDVIGLIVLPIVAANEQPVVLEDGKDPAPALDEEVKIKSVSQDPDLMRKLGWGIGLLLLDAAGFIYLGTATSLHRHFHHRGHANAPPFG